LATEAERYLRKAQESLASAEADLAAGCYNSAANRAYYAAFQAAVAALIHWQVRAASTRWEHQFVPMEFSTHLIRRRKVVASRHRSVLNDLFRVRITADYEITDVSQRVAQSSVRMASAFVSTIRERVESPGVREPESAYNVDMTTKTKDAQQYIEEFKTKILEQYPDVDFEIQQRGETQFTLRVYGDYEEMLEVPLVLGDAPMDALEFDGVWIVVLGLPRDPLDDSS
jgi:uncharacterized protein (UPF0332 family)